MGFLTTLLFGGKALDFAIKVWKSQEGSEWNSDDVEALAGLLEGAAEGLSTRSEFRAAAQYTAFVTRAFRDALGKHQLEHGLASISLRWRRLLEPAERDRKKEIELRFKLAITILEEEPPNDQDHRLLESMSGSPVASPYYQALWKAFTERSFTDEEGGEVPPLDLRPGATRAIEQDFLVAYHQRLAAAPELRAYLQDLAPLRASHVRDRILRELATWGERHVFGNVRREERQDATLSFLALDQQYVEPLAQVVSRAPGVRGPEGKHGSPRPILALLRELLGEAAPPKVLVVTADFGSGKSLSARKLACELAREFLASPLPAPSAWRPAYVRCAESFISHPVNLEEALRDASWRTVLQTGTDKYDTDDQVFSWPAREQRFLCLLDGLDEVTLGREELRALFQRLSGKTTATHRFIVFTRPGVLPEPHELGNRVQELQVLPFEEQQIADWLGKWRANTGTAGLDLAQLAKRGLRELAATPILLLMIAFTWAEHAGDGERSKALLYEQFFLQLARGKAERDRGEQHRPIHDASERLLEALRSELGEQATPSDAMLWLMSRLAWEALRLEQGKQRALEKYDVEHLLREELPSTLPRESMSLIQLGLVLTLQADLRADNTIILFGHQSFREFLVARYWAQELHRLVREGEASWHKTPTRLLGARLLGRDGRSFEFLMQILNHQGRKGAWSNDDREKLVRWAARTFNDETLGRQSGRSVVAAMTLREDQRLYLREAALAIGSSTTNSSGIAAESSSALRSLLSAFWFREESAIVIAAQYKSCGASLAEATLQFADLRGARLPQANMQQADLQQAQLQEAYLQEANLQLADLQEANFERANLQRAILQSADLDHAMLAWAHLDGAQMQRADLQYANLERADLQRADLRSAVLHNANLEHANLQGGCLVDADLREANLQYVNLTDADLTDTSLLGADLRGADLRRSCLRGAKIDSGSKFVTPSNIFSSGRDPVAARFDGTTLWPEGFEPPRVPIEQTPPPIHEPYEFANLDHTDYFAEDFSDSTDD